MATTKQATGVRLREDQTKSVNRFLAKTSYGYADYVRGAVDLLQALPHDQQYARVQQTAAMPRKRRDS